MRSLNRVMLIGHLASKPEFRQTKTGVSVANFPVATNHLYRNENGEKKEIVDFHRVVAWGRLAEICNEYLDKGVAVYVEGRLVNRSFDDKNGTRHYRTEIIADTLNILTWKKTKSGNEIGIEDVDDEQVTVVEEEDPNLVAA